MSGYLAAASEHLTAATVNGQRWMLLTLWRAAYDRGLIREPPRGGLIRRLPEEVEPPKAWTVEEIGRLLKEAAREVDPVAGIPGNLWWVSMVLAVYWTGCRIGALIQTPTSGYDGESLMVRKQKNRRPQWYRLPASCCEAIDRTDPRSRDLLWPWPYHRSHLFVWFRDIVEAAGLECPRTHGQLFHRLRRTTLSLCAAVDPAIAQRQAGHSDYATTLRHYIDPRIGSGQQAADVLADPLAFTGGNGDGKGNGNRAEIPRP